MRLIIQRVSEAAVSIENKQTAQIGKGLLVLVGIEQADTLEDVAWLSQKLISMRIFPDESGKMNRSVGECLGDVLVVSQFTLFASTKKGNRPSFIRAAAPEYAIPLYEAFVKQTEQLLGKVVQTGKFGADMKIRLINDGPVTIQIDSKQKE
jgi:D-tyrosyl-tRNA(Tyr) deacylase